MPIVMELRRENGALVTRAEHRLALPFKVIENPNFPLLDSAHPYLDVMYNTRQMPRLLTEAQRLLEDDLEPEERASLEELAALCREGMQRTHRYLWFIGD
jgi:hypothetical protein